MSLGREVLEQVAIWDAGGRNDLRTFGKNLWRFEGFANKRFKVVTIEVRDKLTRNGSVCHLCCLSSLSK